MKKINRTSSRPDAQSAAPHLQQSAGEAMKGPATALRFLIIVIGSILVAEILVMFFLSILPPLSPNLVAFLDAFLLAVVTFPVLYLALFRPLVRQITETQRAEEQLRKINEELKNFIHIVSHDLKTPIISIQGFAARLLKNYQEKLGDKGRNYLERIKSSACRMEMLISDLLALSKIGRVASTFEDVSALEIVKEVISTLQYRIKENGIEVVLPPGLPVIYADQARIYQVFENLLVNAIKYMGNTKNPRIDIGCEDRGNFHRFYIRDNGSGIDPQYHRKIFEMFYRLKETRAEDGTGLGLAIVDRIARNHGGKVWVESEKGKGAAFYFDLPKKKMESDLSSNCHSKSP